MIEQIGTLSSSLQEEINIKVIECLALEGYLPENITQHELQRFIEKHLFKCMVGVNVSHFFVRNDEGKFEHLISHEFAFSEPDFKLSSMSLGMDVRFFVPTQAEIDDLILRMETEQNV